MIALLGTAWALFLNYSNYSYLENKAGMVSDGMILTADDPSYLAPAENFVQTGSWKDNSRGVSSYVQRPPGMGLLHLVCYKVLPANYAPLQKCIHYGLHFVALFLVGLTIFSLTEHKLVSIIGQIIYGLLPIFWGYLNYYLSESITPSFVVFLCFTYVKYVHQRSMFWLILQSIIVGGLMLLRPQLMILLLPFIFNLVQLLRGKSKKKVLVLLGCLILGFGGWTLWQIRTISITGGWHGLHPIYHVTNNTQYRPIHGSFTRLYKTWSYDSPQFHRHMTTIWYKSEDSLKLVQNTDAILNEIPDKVMTQIGEENFRGLLIDYNLVGNEIIVFEKANLEVPGESQQETTLRVRVDSISDKLKKRMWLSNNFMVPMKSTKFLFSKSQLNLAIFQTKYRGQFWMEGLRWLCVIGIIGMSFLTLIGPVLKRDPLMLMLTIVFVAYSFYLVFVQKMNEERYLVPMLPVMYLVSLFTLIGKRRPH